MGKSKVEVKGRMGPQFISQIARSAAVNRTMKETAEGIKTRLEAKAKAKTKGRGRFRNHYGIKRKLGSYKWGSTWIIWASTAVAKDNTKWFRSAISKATATFKRSIS